MSSPIAQTQLAGPGAAPEPGAEWRETERHSPRFEGLETWPMGEVLEALLSGQQRSLHAVHAAKSDLERAIAQAASRLKGDEGRLVYVGAGTSGRLAVLDGIELTPTFSWPAARIVYLFAGGDAGLRHAQERAEDDVAAGRAGIDGAKVGPHDVVIAPAASGTTPYTRAAVQAARARGALTVSFANNPNSPLLDDADIGILLRTGPEVIAGSTRLAAGTSQKMALNLFSTGVMVALNHTYRGYMVDLQVSNEKLAARARDMLIAITGCSPEDATAALETSGNNVKLGVLIIQGLNRAEAEDRLAAAGGSLGMALQNHAGSDAAS